MISEEKRALDEAKQLIKTYGQKYLIKHLMDIETIIMKIDTPASLECNGIVVLPKPKIKKESTDKFNKNNFLFGILIGILFGIVFTVVLI